MSETDFSQRIRALVGGLFDEKTDGQKSRKTVLLIIFDMFYLF
jgi:hypothetical protein